MKNFFMKESSQSFINIGLAIYILIGLMISFIGNQFIDNLVYPTSLLVSLVLLLAYNYWISEELYKRRKQ
jgi:hypothetical protein